MKTFGIILYIALILLGIVYLLLPVKIFLKKEKIGSAEEYEKRVKQIKIRGIILIAIGVLFLLFEI